MPKVLVRVESPIKPVAEDMYVHIQGDVNRPFGEDRIGLAHRERATDFKSIMNVTNHSDLIKQCFRSRKLIVEVEDEDPREFFRDEQLTATEIKMRQKEAEKTLRYSSMYGMPVGKDAAFWWDLKNGS